MTEVLMPIFAVLLSIVALYINITAYRKANRRAEAAEARAKKARETLEAAHDVLERASLIMARFVDNQMSFNNYIKTEPEAMGPDLQPAALIEQDAVDHVRKYWGLKDAQAGMYLLLHPNGNGTLMTESNFKARFVKRILHDAAE